MAAKDPVVGYVPGAWDMFHVGHLNILLRAREQCDRLVVGVVTDEALFKAKAKHPVIPLSERMQVVAHLNMVDDVVVDFSRTSWRSGTGSASTSCSRATTGAARPRATKLEADMATVGVTVYLLPLHRAHVQHLAPVNPDRALRLLTLPALP